jgi:GTP-binding protein
MKWHNAQFITTRTDATTLPYLQGSFEAALVGRSNAGKSSFLNALTTRHSLAKTAKAPGKTRHINLFSVDEKVFFVDLPGYGYAKRSKEEQKDWSTFISTYLQERKSLQLLILIMDCRRPLEKEEDCIFALSSSLQLPLLLILNKCDKLSQADLIKTVAHMKSQVPTIDILAVSSKMGKGIEEARKKIEQYRKGARHAVSS